jgi:hypothetical protein
MRIIFTQAADRQILGLEWGLTEKASMDLSVYRNYPVAVWSINSVVSPIQPINCYRFKIETRANTKIPFVVRSQTRDLNLTPREQRSNQL